MGSELPEQRFTLDSAASRAEFVYSTLRAAIRDGELRPGQRLREAEIANKLKVSRTPVRDAFGRLVSDGLLAYASPRGLVVAELDQQQVTELYAVREAMEGLAARLAAQHASDTEIDAMRAILAREAKEPSADPQVLAELNRRFHELLYGAARNRYVSAILKSVRDSEFLLRTTYAVPSRPATARQEHEQIVNAIVNRDAAAAEEAARFHIQRALQARLVILFDRDDGTAASSVSRWSVSDE